MTHYFTPHAFQSNYFLLPTHLPSKDNNNNNNRIIVLLSVDCSNRLLVREPGLNP